MAIKKEPKADLKTRYPLVIQIGLAVALLVLIAAFRFNLTLGPQMDVEIPAQESIELEQIEQTKQIEKPPPPIRPPVPIEVPNDELLEDDVLDIDSEIDFEEPAELPPPPATKREEDPEPEVFIVVEQMPELIGGPGELQRGIRYPEIAKKAGVEGTVTIEFIVDEEGNVLQPSVLKGIGAGCDEEALRVVKDAKFVPGRQRGVPVKVKFAIPIRFRLK